MNAVLSGIKELRNAILLAQERLENSNRRTILFIDEVHRFTAAQQDALLPSVENGTITFIGATTENPYYSINKALLSRTRIFNLSSLDNVDLLKIIYKVINYFEKLENPKKIIISEEASNHLIKYSSGDARTLINALELIIEITSPDKNNVVNINLSIAEDSIQAKNIIYDKDGQIHFEVVSAFIKSIRGSDPDATLYWLAYMLEAGEDPNFIFRRLLISACEDIGLADPNAIVVINSCQSSFEKVGFPEGIYFLTQAALFLAISPKSDSNKSIFKAIEIFKRNELPEVPYHLKNKSENYKNPHNFLSHWVDQNYMPTNLQVQNIWSASNNGWEKIRGEKLKSLKKQN